MNKKTLLFHVRSFLAGGIEKVLIELLRALDPDKYRILLSIAYDLGDKQVMIGDLPPYVEVHYLVRNPLLVHTYKKKHTANIGVAEKLLGELIVPPIRKKVQKRALKKLVKGADVVIDFDTTLAGMHDVFAHKKSAAYCHFSFTQIWTGNTRKRDKLAKRLSHYDRVVMLCDEMKEDTAALYPFLKEKLVRIFNAMDKERIKKLAAAPVDLSMLSGQEYIVSVGRLHEAQKDFTTLLKAYIDCVRRYGIKEHLVIVGRGEARERLEQFAAQEGMSDRIHFTGFDANPYRWIAHSKLFLFSSKYEGLPTVIIEAHLLDKPVIATDCPTGVRELLMQGRAGILTPVGDVKAMSDAIQRLITDEALQQEFLENVKGFLHNFDTSFMVEEFERLLLQS
jgi:glycosyltransferase involved in cell wall biosynthesis